MNKNNAFTMIELLVVITIIIVLTAIGAVSYSAAQRKGRDSKRMADLEQIRAALEMYRTDNDEYPADLPALESGNYLNIPEDPKGYSYYYNPDTDNYLTYSVYAYLEADTGGDDYGNHCGSAPGNCNYEVTNP